MAHKHQLSNVEAPSPKRQLQTMSPSPELGEFTNASQITEQYFNIHIVVEASYDRHDERYQTLFEAYATLEDANRRVRIRQQEKEFKNAFWGDSDYNTFGGLIAEAEEEENHRRVIEVEQHLLRPPGYAKVPNQDGYRPSTPATGELSERRQLEARAAAPALPPPYYPIVYHVTGTRTIITAHIQTRPIDARVVGATAQHAQNVVNEVIRSQGDGWLPPMHDPYTMDFLWGCYIHTISSKKLGPSGATQHLTWGILSSTYKGLFQIAYVQGYSQEMTFDVLDSNWGTVGHGYIMAGSIYGTLVQINGTVNGSLVADS
ncbi:MAG: hypothetical protein Q9170_002602 [Blastenia crenularia]